MRLFLALPLSSSACDEIGRTVERLKAVSDECRWTSRDAWHITLQFLGDCGPDRLEDLVAHLRNVKSRSIPIQLRGLGFFERAGVAKIEVDLSPELAALQQKVVQATIPCGFVPEERPYRPHLTLARTKKKLDKHARQVLDSATQDQARFSRFVAEEFRLYESFLGREGSKYEIRERFSLAPREP